jgi:hypothetical protein
VPFVFDDTRRDEIFIGNILLSTLSDTGLGGIPVISALPSSDSPLDLGISNTNDENRIKSMRSVQLANGPSVVDIELTSNRRFLPQGELLVLLIGDREFSVSRYPETGEINAIIFTLTVEEFAQVTNGDHVSVQYGAGVKRTPGTSGTWTRVCWGSSVPDVRSTRWLPCGTSSNPMSWFLFSLVSVGRVQTGQMERGTGGEVSFHLEMPIEENIKGGMTREQARCASLRQLLEYGTNQGAVLGYSWSNMGSELPGWAGRCRFNPPIGR